MPAAKAFDWKILSCTRTYLGLGLGLGLEIQSPKKNLLDI